MRKTKRGRERDGGVGGGRGERKGGERHETENRDRWGERKASKRRQKKSPEGHMTVFSQKLLGCNSHCNYSNKCTLISLAALQIRHNSFSKFGA